MFYEVPKYLQMNRDLVSSSDCASFRLQQANNFWTSKANSLLYFPSFIDNNCDYLILPQYSIWQVMQNWQNNGSFGMGCNMNWNGGTNFNNTFQWPWNNNFNNMFQWPWNNNNNNNNSNSNMTDAEKNEFTTIKDKIEKLTTLLNTAKETIVPATNSAWKEHIRDAVNKPAGNLNDAKSKLEALEKEYKKFNTDDIKKLMVDMPEVKSMLYKYGYNYSIDSFGYKDSDDTLTKINSIATEIPKLTDSNTAAPTIEGLTKDNIVRIISAWNDSHNAYNNRSIILALKPRILNGMKDPNKRRDAIKKIVQPLCNALTGAASQFLNENRNYLEKETQDKITNISAKVATNCSTLCTAKGLGEGQFNNLEIEFSKLYGLLRRCAAAVAYKKIEEKYEFIDKINGAGNKVFDNKLFKNATTKDLTAEGIKDTGFDDIKITQSIKPNEPIVEDDDGIPNPMTAEFLKNSGQKLSDDTEIEFCRQDNKWKKRKIKDFKGNNDEYYIYNNSIYKVNGNKVTKLENARKG